MVLPAAPSNSYAALPSDQLAFNHFSIADCRRDKLDRFLRRGGQDHRRLVARRAQNGDDVIAVSSSASVTSSTLDIAGRIGRLLRLIHRLAGEHDIKGDRLARAQAADRDQVASSRWALLAAQWTAVARLATFAGSLLAPASRSAPPSLQSRLQARQLRVWRWQAFRHRQRYRSCIRLRASPRRRRMSR